MGKIGVLFVCYGNICRSPMAEFVFKKLLDEEGLSDRFYVGSAGTSGEHIGDHVDSRAAEELRMHGISRSASSVASITTGTIRPRIRKHTTSFTGMSMTPRRSRITGSP